MYHIQARNVNQALKQGLLHLFHDGIEEPSRNGPVLVAPGPVTTTYERPTERVLFSPQRNANPFFHMMEALWMLAGRNDLAWPVQFNKNFSGYSDDGETCWGAYGWRWQSFFGYDQLPEIVEELQRNPDSRRCVLSMWNAAPSPGSLDVVRDTQWPSASDLHRARAGGKDVPCNTHAYFDRRGPGGALNMTVCNRSNDIIWGAYGANAVHFSVLQEFLAAAIGCPVGVYRQMSNNFHMYTELYPQIVTKGTMRELGGDAVFSDHYNHGEELTPMPLVNCGDITAWLVDLEDFMADPLGDVVYLDAFFDKVAAPMYIAWHEYKATNFHTALTAANHIAAPDWRLACVQWLERRKEARDAQRA